jgi:hypothetical protein
VTPGSFSPAIHLDCTPFFRGNNAHPLVGNRRSGCLPRMTVNHDNFKTLRKLLTIQVLQKAIYGIGFVVYGNDDGNGRFQNQTL